jgi:hypothetical protein
MERSWLIQRLQKPHDWDNPFSFGGGLKNGGISNEGMEIVRKLFAFDYMGSAEFEYGAVPEALQAIFTQAQLGNMKATKAMVYFSYTGWGKDPAKDGTVPIYIICQPEHLKEIINRISSYAIDAGEHKYMTKEPVMLSQSLGSGRRTCGWLELDNGYMFFSDKEMFERTCQVFGIEFPAKEKPTV